MEKQNMMLWVFFIPFQTWWPTLVIYRKQFYRALQFKFPVVLQLVNWWARMCKKSNSGTCWPQFKLKFKVLWSAIVLKYIGSIIQRPCRSPANQVFTSVKEKLVQQLCFSTKKTKCTIVEKYTGYKNIFHKREFGFRIL